MDCSKDAFKIFYISVSTNPDETEEMHLSRGAPQSCTGARTIVHANKYT